MATQQLTETERLGFARAAYDCIEAATTKEQVRQVFQDFYLRLGHKVIARMLLGQSPEKACRIS